MCSRSYPTRIESVDWPEFDVSVQSENLCFKKLFPENWPQSLFFTQREIAHLSPNMIVFSGFNSRLFLRYLPIGSPGFPNRTGSRGSTAVRRAAAKHPVPGMHLSHSNTIYVLNELHEDNETFLQCVHIPGRMYVSLGRVASSFAMKKPQLGSAR